MICCETKKILIVGTGVGGGHNSAARALDKWAQCKFAGHIESSWLDILDYTDWTFRKIYADSYQTIVNRIPSLWKFLYSRMQIRRAKQHRFRQYYDARAYPHFNRSIRKIAPEVVICTHFMPANVVTSMMPQIPVYVVVTDYDAHSIWINQNCQGYFVANEQVKFLITASGFPADKVHVTGIPIAPDFIDPKPHHRSELPTILLMAGGFGSRYLKKALAAILSLPGNFRLLTIVGKNPKLQTKLQKKFSCDQRLQVIGFTKKIANYMAMSDFIITKAGGLTVTESLACNLPLVIFNPTPGQEEENTHFLMENGVAWRATTATHLQYKVASLLQNPQHLRTMSSNCQKIKKVYAGQKILETLMLEQTPVLI